MSCTYGLSPLRRVGMPAAASADSTSKDNMSITHSLCDSYDEEGVLGCVAAGLPLVAWGEEQHVLVQGIVLVLVLMVAGLFHITELVFLRTPCGLALLLLITGVSARKGSLPQETKTSK